MDNPFEQIVERLDLIEKLLKSKLEATKVELSEPEFLTVKQAAELLSLSKQTVYQKCSRRELPHIKTGKHLLFERSELLEVLKNLKVKSKQQILNNAKL